MLVMGRRRVRFRREVRNSHPLYTVFVQRVPQFSLSRDKINIPVRMRREVVDQLSNVRLGAAPPCCLAHRIIART